MFTSSGMKMFSTLNISRGQTIARGRPGVCWEPGCVCVCVGGMWRKCDSTSRNIFEKWTILQIHWMIYWLQQWRQLPWWLTKNTQWKIILAVCSLLMRRLNVVNFFAAKESTSFILEDTMLLQESETQPTRSLDDLLPWGPQISISEARSTPRFGSCFHLLLPFLISLFCYKHIQTYFLRSFLGSLHMRCSKHQSSSTRHL